jgi:hypothetical protein
VLSTFVLAAAGIVVFTGIVVMLMKSRHTDLSDHVPQSVLTRINAEYRDSH